MSEEDRLIRIHCYECNEYIITMKKSLSKGKQICQDCYDQLMEDFVIVKDGKIVEVKK